MRAIDFPSDAHSHLRIFHCGVEFFPALVQAIDSARHEIYLETYIFSDDPTGEQVAAALVAAAMRGVIVHLMIDGFGSKEYPKTKLEAMRQQGVQIRIYRPGFLNFRFLRAGIRRLHRKLVVIDRQRAFVGGINILHDFDHGCTAPRYDFAVGIEGPLVDKVLAAVTSLWWLVSWSQLKRREKRSSITTQQNARPPQPPGIGAEFILRDNLRNRHTIEKAYLSAIHNAKKRIIIANAYFLPGRALLQAIMSAAKRGVEVSLLLQGRVEYFMQHHASQYLYDQLIDAGVRIFLYRPALLHAKVAVVDDNWATVGSSNLDPFSLQLAREANILVREPSFAHALASELQRAMNEDAASVMASERANSSLYKQVVARLSYVTLRVTQQLVVERS